MTVFFTVTKQTLDLLKQELPTRQFSAVFLMLALLMPIAAPIPAWASTLNIMPVADDGLRLTAPSPSLAAAVMSFADNLFSGFASFVSLSKDYAVETDKTSSLENLEEKVKSFKTEIKNGYDIKIGEALPLAALPLDKKGNILDGVTVKWKSSDSNVLEIVEGVQAVARKEGEVILTVSSEKLQQEFLIKINKAAALPTGSVKDSKTALVLESAAFNDPEMERAFTENLYTPENNLGTPPGQTERSSPTKASAVETEERAGSANYSFDLPVASLPGRGINASVGITYNSRVWYKWSALGSTIFTFNNDQNWLAPGFMVGYGYLDRYSDDVSASGFEYSLTSSNGTRHELKYKQNSGGYNIYESTDGTLVQASVLFTSGETGTSMEVRFPDGSKVLYGASNAVSQTYNQGRRYPIKITDRNGNIINITYLSGDTVGKIDYITDTLGRVIDFHYDATAAKNLVAVSVPGYNGSSTRRQTIRFYYDENFTLDAQGRFEDPNSDSTVISAPTTPKVLKFVYFPGTQAGFKYEYSPYFGSIYKITQLRGMQISEDVNNPNSLTTTGTVTSEGAWAASTHYNYPSVSTDLTGPLPDVPEYTWRKDSWEEGLATPRVAQTNFAVDEYWDVRRTTITSPDGTKMISDAKIAPGLFDDGLIQETKIVTTVNGQDKVWSKTKPYWIAAATATQGRSKTRLDKIEVTNDAGQIRATSFGYDSYNNQTLVIEHDFAAENALGTELRRTETTYETNANYINNHLYSLPLEIKTKVNNVYVSKVKYDYDGDTLEARSFPIANTHDSGVSPYRGNVTKVTAFSDATLATDANASVTTMKYDVAGSPVQASVNCCQLKTWTYDSNSNFAYPLSESKGNTGQLTTSYNYDFSTGLLKDVTDSNNQKTEFTYNSANLRQTRTDYPNGSWSTAEYNDTAYPFYVKQTGSLDANRSVSSWSYMDGRGQAFRTRGQTANGYLSGDAEFDLMGRVFKSYNPYTVSALNATRPTSGIPYTEVTQRDGLGRALVTTLPDGTTVQASYNGLVMTATDQAGKQRRQTIDTLGRVVKVDEPDQNGNLNNQPTFYEYDGNNNLTKVTQSMVNAQAQTITQERKFKYDSLSRITHEKQVEATATLNDIGQKTGNSWTGYYKYNLHGLLEKSVDARGVTATYAYDGLNRIETVTYTGETGYQTPKVTYIYDQPRNDAGSAPYLNHGRLTTVKTDAVSATGQTTPETIHLYDYDKVGQVVNHTQSIGNQSYNLQYGYNLAGQLTSQKYPSGKVVNMTVDDFGTMQTVADSQRTYLSGVTINNQGLLSQVNLGNGTTETFSYNDERLQMESQELKRGTDVLQKYVYSFGQVDLATGAVDESKNNGQFSKIESFIGTSKQWSQRFKYDHLGRLAEAREYKAGDNNQLSYKQVFDFDRFGNLYRKTGDNPTTGQQNPLSYTPIEDGDINKSKNQFASGTTYDDAGNVITDNKFRQMSFTYDGNGRRIKATATNQDASTVYDGIGNRVATRSYDLWRYMIYDAFGKLVAEYGISSQSTGGVQYVQQDWQGSVRTVTNAGGFVTSRTDYQAFGEEIGEGVGLRSVGQGYSAGKAARQGYGLTEEDEATGQQHTWFRKLETQAGRWTSPDPYKGSMEVGNPQSFNRYSYVGNDPINFVDPSGLFREPEPQPDWSALISLYLGGLSDNPISPVDVGVPIEPGGGGGSRSPATEETTCEKMANDLQNIANSIINRNGGRTNSSVVNQFNKSMGLRTFGDYFSDKSGPSGIPLKSALSSVAGWLGSKIGSNMSESASTNHPGTAQKSGAYIGQDGFYQDYREGDDDGWDQVHHFGAYFGAGLAGASWSASLYDATDSGNSPDLALGKQGYALGQYIQNNPSKLKGVGQLIKDTICNGKSVPTN